MKPSIGRIVHFHRHPDPDVAAIVTRVLDDNCRVTLSLFLDNGIVECTDAEFGKDFGQWSWPERS